MLWHGHPFDLVKTPITAHRALAQQTVLPRESLEAVFIGITPIFAVDITLFNQSAKRIFNDHSSKYLFNTEPISTSYVVAAPIHYHILDRYDATISASTR